MKKYANGIDKTAHSRPRAIVRKVVCAAIWLVIWYAVSAAVGREILIVSPVTAAVRLFELASTAVFWKTAVLSLVRISLGCLAGIVSGTVLAAATSASRVIYDFFKPFINVIKASPVASFIILALVWLRRDSVPIFISFLIALPIVWANVSEGFAQTDRGLLEMARLFRVPVSRQIARIYIPCATPYFLAGCATAIGLGWKAGIAAEVLSLPEFSVGRELYNAKIYIETADLFAWTAAVVIMSVALEKLTVFLLKKVTSHGRKEDVNADNT